MTSTPTYRGSISPTSSGEGANNSSRFYMLASCIGDVSTEVQYQYKERTAGALDRLQVYISSNGKTSANQTWHSRVATANGAQTVTVTHGTTGRFEDTTNSDSISSGALVDVSFTNGGGDLGVIIVNLAVCRFTATSGLSSVFGCNNASGGAIFGASAAGTTNYLGLSGFFLTLAATETDVFQTHLRSSGTISNWQTYVSANGRSTTSTLTSRYDGAPGNGSVSITASTTGLFEDTTNSDTVATGHKANYAWTLGTGSGTLSVMFGAARFVGTTTWDCIAASDAISNQSIPSISVNNFAGVLGSSRPTQTEANVQTKVYESNTVSHLLAYVGTNSSGTNVTSTFRIGGADGNQTVTITASTTGLYEDTTNSDTLANGSLINFKHTPPNSQTFDINQWSVRFGSSTNTETASAVMGFGPIAFAALSGDAESGQANLAFGPLAFHAVANFAESASAKLAFGPIAFAINAKAEVVGTAVLAFGGPRFIINATDVFSPGRGLRQFWTF